MVTKNQSVAVIWHTKNKHSCRQQFLRCQWCDNI